MVLIRDLRLSHYSPSIAMHTVKKPIAHILANMLHVAYLGNVASYTYVCLRRDTCLVHSFYKPIPARSSCMPHVYVRSCVVGFVEK